MCDCGNTTFVAGQSLARGSTKSCGCFKRCVNDGLSEKYTPKGCTNLKARKPDAPLNKLFYHYKLQAKYRKIPFELNKEFFLNVVVKKCEYCECLPNQIKTDRSKTNVFIHHGLDRVDNGKGYTEDNVVSCCAACNRAKHIMSLKNFNEWIEAVYRTLQKKRSVN